MPPEWGRQQRCPDDVKTNFIDLPEEEKPSYPGNIFQAPVVADPAAGDLVSTAGSPAIDAADPLCQ